MTFIHNKPAAISGLFYRQAPLIVPPLLAENI